MSIPETWTLEDFAREMERRAVQRAEGRARSLRLGRRLDVFGVTCTAFSAAVYWHLGVSMPAVLAFAFGLSAGMSVMSYYARKSEAQLEEVARLEREVLVMAAREGR